MSGTRPSFDSGARLDRLRRPTVRLAAVGASASALVVSGVLLIAGASGDAGSGGDTPVPEPAPVGGGPDLPLDLAGVGFVPNGTVEIAASSEDGPGAVNFCNQRPEADGLVSWNGNRLTEDGERRRVAQTVAHFETSVDAGNFLRSSSDTAGCGSWRTSDGERTFTVIETVAPTIHGDDTRVFELQMDGPDGPTLFLRTVLVRSRTDVLQLTFVSANRQDLGELDGITELAVRRLGFER